MYFTSSSNILNSLGNHQFFYGKLCLALRCVTRTRWVWNRMRIFPYKQSFFEKILRLWFNKKCSLNISSWNALRVAHSRKLSPKKHDLEVYANYVQCELTPHWTDCCFNWRSKFIMIRFGSPERDYSLPNRDTTLEKGLRSQHSKDVQLHDSLGSPTSSKRTPYVFC